MGTLFEVAVQGDLSAYAKDHEKALGRAITRSVRGAASYFRKNLQKQIRSNFVNAAAFARSISLKNSTGYTTDPMSVVTPKAVYPAGSLGRTADVDLVQLFTTSGTVSAAGHQWLAIPAPDAPWRGGRGTARQMTPAETGQKFVFIKTANPNTALLCIRHKGAKQLVVAFFLEKMVKRDARLDVDTPLTAAGTMIDSNFQSNWASEANALEDEYGTR